MKINYRLLTKKRKGKEQKDWLIKMELSENAVNGYGMIFGERDVSLYRAFRHELGNPLTVISGYLEETEGRETFADPFLQELDDNREYLEDFIEKTEKIVYMLDQENWAPPNTVEKIRQYENEFDGKVGEDVDEVVEMLVCLKDYQDIQSSFDGGSISIKELVGTLEADYDAEITYDVCRDTEVRANKAAKIISRTVGDNWAKYGSETGKALQDEEAKLAAHLYSEDDEIVFRVGDNGPGLDNGQSYEDVFEENNGRGTGFGLHLSKHIINCFGGSIEGCQDAALNEEGFGCEFRLKKPKTLRQNLCTADIL